MGDNRNNRGGNYYGDERHDGGYNNYQQPRGPREYDDRRHQSERDDNRGPAPYYMNDDRSANPRHTDNGFRPNNNRPARQAIQHYYQIGDQVIHTQTQTPMTVIRLGNEQVECRLPNLTSGWFFEHELHLPDGQTPTE